MTKYKYRTRIPMVARDVDPPVPLSEQMFVALNRERAAFGLVRYEWDARAAAIAQARTEEMAVGGWFAHENPLDADTVDEYFEYLRDRGIWYLWAGENIALNNLADPVAAAMTALMKSPTHRANILEDDAFDSVGIGHSVNAKGHHLFAQIFLGGAAP